MKSGSDLFVDDSYELQNNHEFHIFRFRSKLLKKFIEVKNPFVQSFVSKFYQKKILDLRNESTLEEINNTSQFGKWNLFESEIVLPDICELGGEGRYISLEFI